MGKVNYRHLKQLKESARKKRQLEKADRRATKETTPTPGDEADASNGEEVTVVPAANATP